MNSEIKITIVLKKDKKPLLANAHIVILTVEHGYITIKNFQIWHSRIYNKRLEENINIEPPSRFAYGHNYPYVYFEDTQKWFELEREIYLAYINEINKKSNDYEEVKPEDVPF